MPRFFLWPRNLKLEYSRMPKNSSSLRLNLCGYSRYTAECTNEPVFLISSDVSKVFSLPLRRRPTRANPVYFNLERSSRLPRPAEYPDCLLPPSKLSIY